MNDITSGFFAELAERGNDGRLGQHSGTLRFDLENGAGAEHWLVTVDQGDLHVDHEGVDENTPADAAIRTDRALFERLVSGEANAMAAMLRGAVYIDGEPGLLVRFQRLLPGPPPHHEASTTKTAARTRKART